MKKLLILALVGSIAISASAQRTIDRHRDDRRYPHRNYADIKRETFQRRVDMINRDFDTQIRYVQHNPRLRNKEKKRQIRQLEKDRKVAINRLRDKYYYNYRDGYTFKR